MRIGIVTLPLHTNYGGILQCYALQQVLLKLGHQPVLIDVPNKKTYSLSPKKMPFALAKRILLRLSGKSKAPILFERHANKLQPYFERHTRRFINTYITSVKARDFNQLANSDFDAIVVGSDQVWRPKYFPSWGGMNIRNAYLDFAKDWQVKKLTYAASFGTDAWEYNSATTSACGTLLKDFNAISVRENSGVDLINQHFNLEAQTVLDPTMLLQAEDYAKLVKYAETEGLIPEQKKYKPYVLSYILDKNVELEEAINSFANSIGTQVKRSRSLSMTLLNYGKHDLEEFAQPPLESWLRDFRDCDYVITDSFHACVFSIIFRKPFVVVGNRRRGISRYETLLGMFGLEDRLILDTSKVEKVLEKPIDYDTVHEKLDFLREQSINFLKGNL